MTPDDVRVLYDYNYWANHRALDACAVLSAHQFAQPIVASFPSVRDTLVHIFGAEWIWHERWHGRSPTALPALTEVASLTGLRERWAPLEARVRAFVAQLTPEALDRVLQYRTTDGQAYAQPLVQQLQHLVNHGTYHRGQVTMMLRQLGAAPVATDLIAYYRQRLAPASP